MAADTRCVASFPIGKQDLHRTARNFRQIEVDVSTSMRTVIAECMSRARDQRGYAKEQKKITHFQASGSLSDADSQKKDGERRRSQLPSSDKKRRGLVEPATRPKACCHSTGIGDEHKDKVDPPRWRRDFENWPWRAGKKSLATEDGEARFQIWLQNLDPRASMRSGRGDLPRRRLGPIMTAI